jgi:hypothetical protein
MISVIGWSGMLLACVGALLVALKLPMSRYAFVCYFVANAFLIGYATLRRDYPVLALNVCLTFISVIGMWCWFRRRERRGPVPVTIECDRFARWQKSMRATLGSHPLHEARGAQSSSGLETRLGKSRQKAEAEWTR